MHDAHPALDRRPTPTPAPGRTVTVEVDEHHLRVLDDNDELLTVEACTNSADPIRHNAYGHRSCT